MADERETISSAPPEVMKAFKEVISSKEPIILKNDPDEPYLIRLFDASRSEDTEVFNDIDRHPVTVKFMGKSSKEDLDWMINATPAMEKIVEIKEGEALGLHAPKVVVRLAKRLDELRNLEDSEEAEGIREKLKERGFRSQETDTGIVIFNESDPRYVFAVADKESLDAVGWVQYYLEDKTEDLKRINVEIPEDAVVMEIAYAKNFTTWPSRTRFLKDRTNLQDKEAKGVAINGVKQTLEILCEMETRFAHNTEQNPRPIIVTAYTEETNEVSENVLIANGFEKADGQIWYLNQPNNVWFKRIV